MARQFAEVAIVAARRTPVGSFAGSLASFSGSQLGAFAIKSALAQAKIAPNDVEECIMGNVLSAGMGQAPARQSALFAGLPHSTVCTTINKVCSSGMKAIMFAAQSIMLGQRHLVVAGGFESMSNVPYYLDKARQGLRYGHGQVIDGVLKDGLWDVYDNQHMGSAGERCARDYKFSREEQDKYAVEAYQLAAAAAKKGLFDKEIEPVIIPQKKGDPVVVKLDEEYAKPIDLKKVSELKPAFEKTGTITAANASKLNDGGCAVVLMSTQKAKELGVKPLALIRSFADAEQEPVLFTTTPAVAAQKALQQINLKPENVDFWEINEAFSVVALANMKLLNITRDKINVDGGAVSMGHPIGMSGARLVTHLTYLLHERKAKVGCASICNGGGGASCVVLERVD